MRKTKHGAATGFAVGLLSAWLFAPAPATGANHLWDLSELYSNSSGSVQFVEMHDDFNVEGFTNGLTLTATNTGGTLTNTFTFPADTSDPINTANHFLLIATAGFGSLPGGVTPDFTLPANFLFTGGGSVTFSGSGDSIIYPALPTNGTLSLTRNLSTHSQAPAVNSPTNFAGASGSVPEPAGMSLMLAGVATLAARRGSRADRRG